MNYTKPEVAVLGETVRVIETFTCKCGTVVECSGLPKINSAYDLDE